MGPQGICMDLEGSAQFHGSEWFERIHEYGIYTFDVKQSDYNPEIGLGGYDVINVEWYKTETERDNIINNQTKDE